MPTGMDLTKSRLDGAEIATGIAGCPRLFALKEGASQECLALLLDEA